MPSPRFSFGVDFGTTNTVVARAGSDGSLAAVRFTHRGVAHETYPSALCFEQISGERGAGAPLAIACEGGHWAIEQFNLYPHDIRYMQSFKSFIANRSFESTEIFRARRSFADLLFSFLQCVRRNAEGQLDDLGRSFVAGRPVEFFGSNPDEDLAMSRYAEAYERAGFPAVDYVYEPVGAAYFYARQLRSDATVLVADFGGGTSDFSVIRFEARAGQVEAHPVAHAGIAIAGDTFDYRIIDNVLAPHLGKNGSYRSFEKILPMPNQTYSHFGRWHQLSLLRAPKTLRQLRDLQKAALEPKPIGDLIAIIENNWGLDCYKAVSQVKAALSDRETAEFVFEKGPIKVRQEVTRGDFESWIGDDLDRIDATVATMTERAEIKPAAIDRVFMTGGSSLIPAVRDRFAARFGAEKLASGDQFQSVAFGLALIGLDDNLDAWTIAAPA